MTEKLLSPAAQAVLDAMYEVNMDFNGENAALAASALRAAADKVVPPGHKTPWGSIVQPHAVELRIHNHLLAIAAELEPSK